MSVKKEKTGKKPKKIPKIKGLSPKRRAFVTEYIKDHNATQAAIRAGYSEKTAQEQSSHLLSLVMVREAVEKLEREILAESILTRERIMELYSEIADDEETRKADRLHALDSMAKVHGMFNDRQEITLKNGDRQMEVDRMFDSMTYEEKVKWLELNTTK